MEKVNLKEKFTLFSDYWSPKIVGQVNDSYVKLAKFKGEFVWHHHPQEDELFFVVKGSLVIKLRDQDVTIHEGEFFIVPQGIEHIPVAQEEVHVMLIELKSTINTGNVENEKTVAKLESL